jgi:hypothetical protein
MPPPLQYDQLQRAEAAARKLSTLMQSASVAQLLQHPPPAVVSKQQQDLLQTCSMALVMLISALLQVNIAVHAEQVRCLEQRV